MAEVKLHEGETLENALRRFKKKVLQENIIGEVKRHTFYLKPGQKLRVKRHWPVNAIGRRHAGKLSRGFPPPRRFLRSTSLGRLTIAPASCGLGPLPIGAGEAHPASRSGSAAVHRAAGGNRVRLSKT